MSGGNGSRHSGNGHDSKDELEALAAVEGKGLYKHPGISDDAVDALELSAGAVFSGCSAIPAGAPAMPDGLQDRLADIIMGHVAASIGIERGVGHQRALARSDFSHERAVRHGTPEQATGSSPKIVAWLGGAGWVAAAALLAVLVTRRPETPLDRKVDPPTLEAQVADLRGRGASVTSWADGGPAGEVVWSDAENRGFMIIDGLEPNDPTRSQFQLWIFRGKDPAAEAHPIDGGVFDVSVAGQVIVPIDAKLDVGSAGIFAVTVEQPGGVVVSERESIVALAVRS